VGWSLSPAPDQHADHGVRLDAPQAKRTASAPLDALVLVAMIVDAGVRAPTLDSARLVLPATVRVPRGPLQPQHPRHAHHSARYPKL